MKKKEKKKEVHASSHTDNHKEKHTYHKKYVFVCIISVIVAIIASIGWYLTYKNLSEERGLEHALLGCTSITTKEQQIRCAKAVQDFQPILERYSALLGSIDRKNLNNEQLSSAKPQAASTTKSTTTPQKAVYSNDLQKKVEALAFSKWGNCITEKKCEKLETRLEVGSEGIHATTEVLGIKDRYVSAMEYVSLVTQRGASVSFTPLSKRWKCHAGYEPQEYSSNQACIPVRS